MLISFKEKQMFLGEIHIMSNDSKYYVVKEKAIPEVLVKVVEAKRLLSSDKNMTVKEATDRTGISRSSFYKYKDDIFPFDDSSRGRNITLAMQILDEPGLLSDLLKVVSDYNANILTIHQSIPVNKVASISLSIEVLETTGNISAMVDDIEKRDGIYDVKILARE